MKIVELLHLDSDNAGVWVGGGGGRYVGILFFPGNFAKNLKEL